MSPKECYNLATKLIKDIKKDDTADGKIVTSSRDLMEGRGGTEEATMTFA